MIGWGVSAVASVAAFYSGYRHGAVWRRLYRRLRGRCLICGSARLGPGVAGSENAYTAEARRQRLCYACTKWRAHARNYGGVA